MLMSLVLQFMHRRARRAVFTWSPSVDLSDHQVYSALLTHTNY